MMSYATIAALIMAGITWYVGASHLLLCRRHLGRRHHFLFSLSCFVVGVYTIFSAGLYSATSVAEGMVWQRAQLTAVSLAALLIVWFVHDYSFRRSKRTIYVFFAYFLVSAILGIVAPDHWLFAGESAVRHVQLPAGLSITYYEARLGRLFQIQSLMGIWAGLYVCVVAAQGFMRHDKRKYATLFVAIVVFFAGVINDIGNSLGLWNFIYLTEYAFMAIVILMSVQLADEIAVAVAMRTHLRTVEERFRSIFKNAAVGIGLINESKDLVTANTALCGMLGRVQWEIQGTPLVDCLHPDDAPGVIASCDDLLGGDLDAFREELRYMQPGRRAYWGDMSIALVRGADGKVAGLLWIIVGVTERRRAVEALRQLNEQLESEVTKRTVELEHTNTKLARSLEILEDDERAGRLMQFSLLPAEARTMGPYEFERYLAPSLYLSGDFVNYFRIDVDHIGFYIADVSGHGVSSAFITVLLQSLVKNALENFKSEQDRSILDPARLMTRLNEELVRQDSGKHVTMFYGILSVRDNTLTYTNGGQFPLPLLRHDDCVETLKLPGTAVGLFDFASFTNSKMQLPPAFELVVFSDGILDIMGNESLPEKQTRLETIIDQPDLDMPKLVARSGVKSVDSLPDDITILMVRRRAHDAAGEHSIRGA